MKYFQIGFFFVLLLSFALFSCAGCRKKPSKVNQLDALIPPEVKNDAFYQAIYRLAGTEQIDTILEIGSSSGEGSTEAFVRAIQENPRRPVLYCMEVSGPRFEALAKRYKGIESVRCYQVSSIPIEAFPSKADITAFYEGAPKNFKQIPLSILLKWYKQDIEYLIRNPVPQNGIDLIKKENGIEFFDMVLIDGSEFTGFEEMKRVYGAKFLLLDDVAAYKNYANRQLLLNDPCYELIEEDLSLRNGYSIFKKRMDDR